MKDFKFIFLIKEVLYILSIIVLGVLEIVFSVLYLETFSEGLIFNYSLIIISITVLLIIILNIVILTYINKNKTIVYKLLFIVSISLLLISSGLYYLKKVGFLDKINSVNDFRNFISSFGNLAIFLFILLQFLQVVVLPIPSFITLGAGVLSFGAFYGALYSVIGIILGSIVAFFIGRIFGLKLVKWIIGEKGVLKGLELIKGKDKIIFTFMFLFPFFPDDLLCFVAGITSISSTFFIIMTVLTRIICVFTAAYSFNNSIIPYDTWWGILLWILFFVLTIYLSILISKKGDKLERIFSKSK